MWTLLFAAHADSLPDRYVGRYIEADIIDSWFTDQPQSQAFSGLDMNTGGFTIDMVMDSAVHNLVEAKGDGTYVFSGNFNPDEEVEGTFAEDSRGIVQFEFGGKLWTRFDDRLPAAAHLQYSEVSTGVMLSRGYRDGDTAWVFASTGGQHENLGDGPDLAGGFAFNDTFVVDDVEYLFHGNQGTLMLEEAAEQDGPDMEALDGGKTLQADAMTDPPFLILADRLNLREKPASKSKVLGVAEGGRWVHVWQREGDWLLIRDEDRVGWGYAPYVGRRTEPLDARPEHGKYTLVEALDTAGVTAFSIVDQPDEARCEFGTAGMPAIPGATSATARVTNLDGDDPLDVVCLIEAGDTWVACPVLRSGTEQTETPCGIIGAFPKDVGGKKGSKKLRDLVLGEKTWPAFENGWFDGELPKPPEPEPTPEPAATPDAAESDGGLCACASAAVIPTGIVLWLIPALVRRRR